MAKKPLHKPDRPFFCSGPSVHHPGHTVQELKNAFLNRSHRSQDGQKKIQEIIDGTRRVLEIPDDYHVAIVPGSATGAIEIALWNFLGPKPVDVISFDVFGKLWLVDIVEQLKLKDVRQFDVDFGELPDLNAVSMDHDVVFTWIGTTAGVSIPDDKWISNNRQGLTICDATASAFCIDMPWEKCDVTTFSWQKGLGSEAAHGMIVLSPRAMERLETYTPEWPMPRLFRLKFRGKVLHEVFKGLTINTPSLLAVEDCIQALRWVEQTAKAANLSPKAYLTQKCIENANVVKDWVKKMPFVEFLAKDPQNQSPVSACLCLNPENGFDFNSFHGQIVALLAKEGVAFDVMNHSHAPTSIRFWTGPMVEKKDLESVLEWVEWAYHWVCANGAKNLTIENNY